MSSPDPHSCPPESRLVAYERGDLPAGERAAVAEHLAACSSCAARLGTRAESAGTIESGFPLGDQPGVTLGATAVDPAAVSRAADPGPPAAGGTVLLGRYKLLERIGQGGMGVVYRAEQVEPIRRRVAVKLIKEGMDTHQVLARFEAERQALALMDHPNIARVLDAGASATGRPYFVMELVQGVPITTYCDEHRLTTRDRLALFITTCRAIQHAHQKGIIHRDIKPANVLVAQYDGHPVVKVIDFGIAKAVGQPLTDRTLVTNLGVVVGTLEYMSPEQAELSPLDIDTRSDVYALGVLLYELLTGSTPLERAKLAQGALMELLRLVREQEPPRPSTRLSSSEALPTIAGRRGIEPARLTPLIRGDLDWITMRALEKDRSRRYETVSGLARDVERHLNDEPVEASPPSARYRLGKFARKNRQALQVALGGAGLLVVATVVSTWQAVRASHAEARERSQLATAEARYALAREAIETFYTGASVDVLLREPRMRELRGKLLGTALQFYRKLQTETDRRGPTAAAPEVQARLAADYETLAGLTFEVGDQRGAWDGYQRALPLREVAAAAAPATVGPRRALAGLYGRIGLVAAETETPETAADWHRRAADEYAAAARLVGSTPDDRLREASERINRGDALARTVRTSEAAAVFAGAIADLRQLAENRPADFQTRRALAVALQRAGYLRLNGLPRPLEATPLIDESNAIFEQLARDHGDDVALREDWARGLHHAAMCREQVGPITAALPYYAQSLAALEPVFRRYPTLSAVRKTMANARIGIGSVLVEIAGREPEALAQYAESSKLLEGLVTENPGVPMFRARLAASESSRAYALDRLANYDEAVRAFDRAISLRAELARDQPTITMHRVHLGEDYGYLGTVHRHAGRPAEALALYRRAIATMGDLRGSSIMDRLILAGWLAGAAGLLDRTGANDRQALINQALVLLQEVADSGFHDPQALTGDAIFAPLRQHPAYGAILLDLGWPTNPFPD